MSVIPPVSSKQQKIADLHQAVDDALKLVEKAHEGYVIALSGAMNTGALSEGVLAARQQGREYANAVRLYSDAVMVWLGFMDSLGEDAAKSRSKPATENVLQCRQDAPP